MLLQNTYLRAEAWTFSSFCTPKIRTGTTLLLLGCHSSNILPLILSFLQDEARNLEQYARDKKKYANRVFLSPNEIRGVNLLTYSESRKRGLSFIVLVWTLGGKDPSWLG
jgi:hypothetical protein